MSEIIIQPGLLVSLSGRISGGINYYRQTLEYPHLTESGQERSRWNNTKIVIDPEEMEKAVKTRDKCRSLVKSVCSSAEFGLLCPEDRKPELIERVAEARSLAAGFNLSAVHTNISIRVFWGVVAQDDVRAVQSIAEEVRNLLEGMQTGLAELDAKKVRALADKAVRMKQVLVADRGTSLDIAVRAARAAATRIVAAGEAVALEIDRNAIRTIGMARTSFLDIRDSDDDQEPVRSTPMPGRALDMSA
jgi:hypothetical protein